MNDEEALPTVTPAITRKASDLRVNLQLIPFTLAAWLGFLAIGIPLPVLSLFVQERLRFDALIVGAVVGAQSFATLISRQFAGRLCDTRGAKPTTLLGLAAASLSGLCYLASSHLVTMPTLAVAALIIGRLLLGFGESLFITAIAAWSVARVGAAHAGRAMAWSGISMYGAIAIGAPIGTWVYRAAGFDLIAACTLLMPILGGLLVIAWQDLPIEPRPHVSYLKVLGRIWAPGLAMALASSGVGTIAAFLPLYYSGRQWPDVGFALTAFGVAYIAMRLLFGGLPDRIGGVTTALVSLSAEAAGLLAIWIAPSSWFALAGATLTGLGYSLIFPSLGVEALKRTSAENRGLVLGAYLACFDLGIAVAGPLAGAVAEGLGLAAVFPAAAGAAVLGFMLTVTKRSSRNAS
jgi:MFS family permease